MLLSLVPSEFVGTPSRLKPLVKLLCLEMEQTFQEKGLTWPPWRQAESMISKWLPTKVPHNTFFVCGGKGGGGAGLHHHLVLWGNEAQVEGGGGNTTGKRLYWHK